MDKPDLILEWGIAAILDPQQKFLSKFHHIFDPMCGVRWLHTCGAYWDNHDEFVKEVTQQNHQLCAGSCRSSHEVKMTNDSGGSSSICREQDGT